MKTKSIKGIVFSIGYLILFSFLFVISLLYNKEKTHLFINQLHSEFLDELMKYWTYMGDGVVLIVIIAFVILFSFRYSIILLGSYLLSGLIAQVLKRFVFSEMPRPVKYFDMQGLGDQLYLVPDVHQHAWHSFPSGHTAAAFAVFFGLAMLSKSKLVQLICFVIALGVAYSRLYLSQHFLMDVVAGSTIGMLSAYLFWLWINRYQADWLDRSALKLKRL